ncbi:MAG: class II aldolase/adducin family protein [Bacilli bacterium]|jgi:ribulose-5-phosphate 4-epimerase/fuculose-1-phosphate aldolase|nr:class II aldolase/adducin family protein [Bacilli bacterium]
MFSYNAFEESLKALNSIKPGPGEGYYALKDSKIIRIYRLCPFQKEPFKELDLAGLKAFSEVIYTAFKVHKDISTVILFPSLSCQEIVSLNLIVPPILDDMAQIIGGKAISGSQDDLKGLKKILKRQTVCPFKGQTSGLVAIGSSPLLATAACLVMDKSATVFLNGRLFGGCLSLKPLDVTLMHLIYLMKYSKKQKKTFRQSQYDFSREFSEEEIRLRNCILELGRRLESTNLIQGTWGNISLRMDQDYMLTTPTGLTYSSLTIYDIVKVKIATLKYEGKTKPTSEKNLHGGIYLAHKEANCIIHAHPVNCSLFAALHQPIPGYQEKHFVAPYALPTTKKLAANVVKGLNDCSSALMENHGIIVFAEGAEESFRKCLEMEKAAKKAIEEKKGNKENG